MNETTLNISQAS